MKYVYFFMEVLMSYFICIVIISIIITYIYHKFLAPLLIKYLLQHIFKRSLVTCLISQSLLLCKALRLSISIVNQTNIMTTCFEVSTWNPGNSKLIKMFLLLTIDWKNYFSLKIKLSKYQKSFHGSTLILSKYFF